MHTITWVARNRSGNEVDNCRRPRRSYAFRVEYVYGGWRKASGSCRKGFGGGSFVGEVILTWQH